LSPIEFTQLTRRRRHEKRQFRRVGVGGVNWVLVGLSEFITLSDNHCLQHLGRGS